MMMEKPFDIVPAIRVAYGRVVGDATPSPVGESDHNPLAQLWYWIARGARRVHVEELGTSGGLPTVPALLLGCSGPVALQVGGGIHDGRTARLLAAHGASTMVLHHGLRNLAALEDILGATEPDRVMPAIDLEEIHDPGVLSGIACAQRFGVSQILLAGPWTAPRVFPYQEEAIRAFQSRGLKVWVAGGIRHLQTVAALKELGVSGVLIGRALHRGVLSFERLRSLAD